MFFIFEYQYAVIGADIRQELLLEWFAREHVCIYFGAETKKAKKAKKAATIEQALTSAENVLFPIPMCKGEWLNAQQDVKLTKEMLLEYVQQGQRIFGGCIDLAWKAKAQEKGAVCYDYMQDDTIAIYNSIATAEGTIAEIIKTYPKNLHDTKVLVLGYGKCAKTLAIKLKALNVKVSIAARSAHALMEAYASGYDTMSFKEEESTKKRMRDYAIIVNTIPDRILTKQVLAGMDKETCIYDIASFPYGVDMDAVKELGMMAYLCPALPAKYAPVSSAEILKQYIIEKQGGNT